MAHIWFTSAPLPGHLDWGGLLKTARVLHAQGHTVLWVSGEPIRALVIRAGVPFAAIAQTGWRWPPPPLPTPTGFVNEDMHTLRYRRALDTWLDPELVTQGTQALLELAGERGTPDVIVTDPFLSAAALAAERLEVPLVVGGWASGPPVNEGQMLAAQRQLGGEALERIAELSDTFGVTGANFSQGPAPSIQSPHLHVSYFSAYWHQDETVLPQTAFVGGIAEPPADDPPEWLADIPADRRLGMVTLGSTFTGDVQFFVAGAQAIASAGLVPLVVIGYTPLEPDVKQSLKAQLPGGTRLLNWVPYDHVFPRLAVLVHHGGMGTTHAAIVHAIPQVIVPHAADQRGQATRASQAKVGLHLIPQDVRRGELHTAVRAITSTEWVLEHVQGLAEQFAALGGPPRAAELIVETVQ